MKMAQWSPMREIGVRVETEITNEEHLIIDELKALMVRNEPEEHLLS